MSILAALKEKITELVGEYPVDVKDFRTERKDWLRDQIFAMSRKQWKVVHWLLREQEWDYFHFVDIGLDRVHHGFWDCFDKQHINYQAGNPYEKVIPDYYLWLDEQIGRVMESLDDDTALLIFSDHGAQKLDGGFAVNQWLIEQGLLVLNRQPEAITPFNQARRELGQELLPGAKADTTLASFSTFKGASLRASFQRANTNLFATSSR